MAEATRGVFITCDIPIKEFLLHLNRQEDGKIVLEDLDDTHLFVTEESIPFIRQKLDELYNENQFSNIN